MSDQISRRHLLAGAAALPLLPVVANGANLHGFETAAETVAPACQIDRARFARRLCQWAFRMPEMGQRIDAMLADVDYVCADGEGSEMLYEAVKVCHEKSGRQISWDWVVGYDHYRSGEPCRMFLDEPEQEGDARVELVQMLGEMDARSQGWMLLLMRALKEDDYVRARELQEMIHADSGITVEQW